MPPWSAFRAPGAGLTVQPRPKTTAGWRIIALPGFAVRMLEDRRASSRRQVDAQVVFPPPLTGTLRDPSNVSGDFRQLLDSFEGETCSRTGYQLAADGLFSTGAAGRRIRCEEGPRSWVTSHTFRKAVATRLDEAGLTARQVADQLGHANPPMTLDVYFGRQVVSAEAAEGLNR